MALQDQTWCGRWTGSLQGSHCGLGVQQVHGVNFQETFAPMVRWESIRIVTAIATHFGSFIHHLDVTTALLNGLLKDFVYMIQPQGFIQRGTKGLVYTLHRSLYGLKQSPRTWYHRIDGDLCSWGSRETLLIQMFNTASPKLSSLF